MIEIVAFGSRPVENEDGAKTLGASSPQEGLLSAAIAFRSPLLGFGNANPVGASSICRFAGASVVPVRTDPLIHSCYEAARLTANSAETDSGSLVDLKPSILCGESGTLSESTTALPLRDR
jgi:hypothetical protein